MSATVAIRGQSTDPGIERIGVGFGLAAGVLVLYHLACFLLHIGEYPRLPFSIAAWALLAVSIVVTQAMQWRRGEQVPGWVLPAALVSWAAAAAIDIVGAWGNGRDAAVPTAAVAVGAALLMLVARNRARIVVSAAVVLGVVLTVTFLLQGRDIVLAFAPTILIIALAVAPSILGVMVLRSLRTLVQLEVDRAQVQSTVTAPGFTVGMLASEELARLDLAAERLLDRVATGQTPLPLPSETASSAASLATELRLHLIEGRRETWLYHAVSESTFLGPIVTVTDPEGLAGLLDPSQRDGLLSAVWLLISEPTRQGQSLHIALGPHERGTLGKIGTPLSVPIAITATGVPRKRVDPAAWHAIKKVGRYVEDPIASGLRIAIECVVHNPVDYQPGGEQL